MAGQSGIQKVLVAVYILKVKPELVEQVSEILTMVTSRTQVKPGCIRSSIWISPERTELMVHEIWRNRTDHKRHLTSEVYRKLLAGLEMSSEAPLVCFSECHGDNGIEMVRTMLERDSWLSEE